MVRHLLAVVLTVSLLAFAVDGVDEANAQSHTNCIAADLSASITGGPSVGVPLDLGSKAESLVIDSLLARLGASSTSVVVFGTSAERLATWDAAALATYRAEVGDQTNLVGAWQTCLATDASAVIIISDFAPDAWAMSRSAQIEWFKEHPPTVRFDGIAFDGADPASQAFFTDLALRSGGTFTNVRESADIAPALEAVAPALAPTPAIIGTPATGHTSAQAFTSSRSSEPAVADGSGAWSWHAVIHPTGYTLFGMVLGAVIAAAAGVGVVFLWRHRTTSGRQSWQVGDQPTGSSRATRRPKAPPRHQPRASRSLDQPKVAADAARYAIVDSAHRDCLVFTPTETVYIDCASSAPRRVAGPGPDILSAAAGRVVFGFRAIALPEATPVRLNQLFTLEKRPS